MTTKRKYATPQCELTTLHIEPLLAVSDPDLDLQYGLETGVNKTEGFGETEEGFWD